MIYYLQFTLVAWMTPMGVAALLASPALVSGRYRRGVTYALTGKRDAD